MTADSQVRSVLRAVEMLEGRIRAATTTEIAFLVPLERGVLEQVLRRAVVDGWLTRFTVRSDTERPGVREGDAVFVLSDIGARRYGGVATT